jgi:hypothetical protein
MAPKAKRPTPTRAHAIEEYVQISELMDRIRAEIANLIIRYLRDQCLRTSPE